MPDQSVVRETIRSLIQSTLLPTGGMTAPTGQTITALMGGWPNSDLLDKLTAGQIVVSVYPDPAMSTNTTRYLSTGQVEELADVPCTLTVAVADPVVTLGGTVAVGQVVGIAFGHPLQTFAYRVPAPMSINQLAANVGAVIPGSTTIGTAITLPTTTTISAAAVMDAQGILDGGMRRDAFHVTTWATSPDDRDAMGAAVTGLLFPLSWLDFPDGTSGHIVFQRGGSYDKAERATLYMRDDLYMVEYHETVSLSLSRVLFAQMTTNGLTSTADAPAV